MPAKAWLAAKLSADSETPIGPGTPSHRCAAEFGTVLTQSTRKPKGPRTPLSMRTESSGSGSNTEARRLRPRRSPQEPRSGTGPHPCLQPPRIEITQKQELPNAQEKWLADAQRPKLVDKRR